MPTEQLQQSTETFDEHLDLLAGMADQEEAEWTPDETRYDALRRERAEKAEAQLRQRLANPKMARGAYQDAALLDPQLTHAQFRLLCFHLSKADPDLSNSFASRKAAAFRLRMDVRTYDWHVAGLRKAGYERSQEFRRANGQQSSSGVQFCLPGRIFASGEPWLGPCRWDNRRSGVPKKSRRNRVSAVDRPTVNGSR